MNDLSDNPKEDGYNIVRLFLQYHPNAEADIQSKADKYSFCSDLAEKHLDEYKEPKKLAVWNIVELFSWKFYGIVRIVLPNVSIIQLF